MQALSTLFFVAVLVYSAIALFASLWTRREAIVAALLTRDAEQLVVERRPVRVRRAPQFAPRRRPTPIAAAA